MKKSFFLYFLVLSPLLFSQNSYRSNGDLLKYYPVYNEFDPINFSSDNLTILERSYSKINENKWLLEPKKLSGNGNEDTFSSLVLMEQLEELNYSTPFQISHNPTLERYIRVYLNDRRESISKLMDKASYYFPIFEEYLDKYDLPIEIKYLAIVESALNPNANSPSGAKGLWQFMYTTGKQFNLNVDSFVDERFDPLKSTEAACKYLSSLYQTFNDWDLALAAYNSGPGNVRKAIKRSGGKHNYWEIRQFLPQETRGYLPAFYATYYIFEYAKTHGIKPIRSELTYFEIDTVHVNKQLSFATIQKNIPINNKLLKALNPQYKRGIIPYSNNKRFVLTLPENLIGLFIENENLIYQFSNSKPEMNTTSSSIKITRSNSYIVKVGDNLNIIAKEHQITLAQLKKWNGLQTDYLIAGQRLVVTDKNSLVNDDQLLNDPIVKTKPFSPGISPKKPSETSKMKTTEINSFETYIVKEGDTLFNISRKYQRVSISQIRSWNNILDIKYLKPGTKLKIFEGL